MARWKAVLTLIFLSPFIAEILLGATPLSRWQSLIPLVLLYGSGAVAIREALRRSGRGWAALLAFGVAYGLMEEGVIMQTLFSPDLFGAAECGGRWLGVNWIWTEELMGYHALWSITIPIALTEACFPKLRQEPWLPKWGLGICVSLYALAALAIGSTFQRLLTPNFRAPLPLLIGTVLVAAVLVLWALRWAPKESQKDTSEGGHAVSPGIAGLCAFAAAVAWMQLGMLPQPLRHGWLALLTMGMAAVLAVSFWLELRRWISRAGWTSVHALFVMGGGITATAGYGVHALWTGSALDRAGQAVTFLLLLGLVLLLVKAQPIGCRECDKAGRGLVSEVR